MRRIAALVVLGLGLAGWARADDAEQVREVFSAYRTAILSADGELAATVMSQGTIDFYAETHRAALCDSPEATRAQPFVNQMLVLHYRHAASRDELLAMSGREPLVYAVDHGWIGRESVEDTEVGAVKIRKKRATARQLRYGEPAGKFPFVKESGGWKIDLVSTLKATSAPVSMTAQRFGGEEHLLFSITETSLGTRPTEKVWEPIAPDAPACKAKPAPANAG